MGKHSVQYAVMVRPAFLAPEVMVGMPFVEKDVAESEADMYFLGGNYSVRVVEYNPITGAIIEPDYNDHQPLI